MFTHEESVMIIAALVNAGLKTEAVKFLKMVSTKEETAAAKEESEDKEQKELLTGIFKVLEVRPGATEGTVRAYAEAQEDGSKVALYGKNGAAKTLSAAVGKTVKATYRPVDKGLFVVQAQLQ